RVVEDLKRQLGRQVCVLKGSLLRKSLSIQILKLSDSVKRYGWILQNINKLEGSGIIYCLTQKDCDYLTDFLLQNGINVRSYYSRGKDDYINKESENLFKENKIKAIISTVKLGMGYDKGDIAFVIHYQQPSNIVSYYQQIGRAGRNIDRAYTFLMCGFEDNNIQNYFINTAFPTKEEIKTIWKFIRKNKGLGISKIAANVNIRRSRIEKAIDFLENKGSLYKKGRRYYTTLKIFRYNKKHYDEITAIRHREQKQMADFVNTKECYGKYIANCLDDYTTENCGICSNCLGYEEFSSNVDLEYINIAKDYLDSLIITIEPKTIWPETYLTKYEKIEKVNEVGICISKYGDPGYGMLVKEDKYSGLNRFRDELVCKSAEVLENIINENRIKYITCVPSLRSDIVEDFTKRLAEKCGLEYVVLLKKLSGVQQKDMKNSSHQCENALKSFALLDNTHISGNIILVDDVVDSGWTLTVCGNLLMEKGCLKVFPFALASSSQKERD
ncbi:MAG: helicase-related protein, partial [Lachnospirales bacterium]